MLYTAHMEQNGPLSYIYSIYVYISTRKPFPARSHITLLKPTSGGEESCCSTDCNLGGLISDRLIVSRFPFRSYSLVLLCYILPTLSFSPLCFALSRLGHPYPSTHSVLFPSPFLFLHIHFILCLYIG